MNMWLFLMLPLGITAITAAWVAWLVSTVATKCLAYFTPVPAVTPPQGERTREQQQSDTTCAICLDDVSAPVELIPCGHVFCGRCVQQYIAQCRGRVLQCPMDRRPVAFAAPLGAVPSDINTAIRAFNSTQRGGINGAVGAVQFARRRWSMLPLALRARLTLVAVSSISYIVSPIDLLPEALLGPIGLLDDAVVFLGGILVALIIMRSHFS
jgi:RING finger protein 170